MSLVGWLVCCKKSRFKNVFEKNYIENFKLMQLARMLNFSSASLSTFYTGQISGFSLGYNWSNHNFYINTSLRYFCLLVSNGCYALQMIFRRQGVNSLIDVVMAYKIHNESSLPLYKKQITPSWLTSRINLYKELSFSTYTTLREENFYWNLNFAVLFMVNLLIQIRFIIINLGISH